MIPLPASTRVFVSTRPVDMRKGHDGLCALAERVIGASPWQGHIFCHFNRALDRCKLLWWDGSGLVLYYKRLECELLLRRKFKSQSEARMAVFEFIEGWYTPHRRHSGIGYLSPTAFERRMTAA